MKKQTLKINKRKIEAKQLIRADHGKVRIKIPGKKGWQTAEDKDWLIEAGAPDTYIVIPGAAMDYLTAKAPEAAEETDA